MTAKEMGVAPPRFPDSKQLGFTHLPNADNLHGLKPAMYFVQSTEPDMDGQATARLRSVRAPVDATVKVWVIQPGEHLLGERSVPVDNVNVTRPHYLRVTQDNSDLVRVGEFEHIDDMSLAFDLTFGEAHRVKLSLNDYVAYGASKAEAEARLWRTFAEALSPGLYRYLYDANTTTINASLMRAYIINVRRTIERDNLKYHRINLTTPVYDHALDAAVSDLDESSARIGSVPSDQIVYL